MIYRPSTRPSNRQIKFYKRHPFKNEPEQKSNCNNPLKFYIKIRLTIIDIKKTRASGAVRIGLSLDPEGRKWLRGSSFALKSRERSFLDFQLLLIFFNLKSHFLDNLIFFNFPQFAPRGEVICDHHYFWPFSAPEIGLKISKFQN